MLKFITTVCLSFLSFLGFSQGNLVWEGHFSYNNITDLSQSDNKIFASTENALFILDLDTNEMLTFNSIDGLKSEQITALHHSKDHNLTLVGNINGLLLIINHNTQKVVSKVDIINNIPVSHNIKRINHFTEYNNKVFIATDYGISVFNLQNMEFGDTYFMSESGSEIRITQTTIHNGELYALTQNPSSIRVADLSNPNLISYLSWDTFSTDTWSALAGLGNHLLTANGNLLYKHNSNGSTSLILNTSQPIRKLHIVQNHLAVTTSSSVYVLDENLTIVTQSSPIPNQSLTFTAATYLYQTLYIGTQTQGVFALSPSGNYLNFIPPGPQRNKIYSLKVTADNLWCVFGDNSYSYNPFFPDLGRYGISNLSSDGWQHTLYQGVLDMTNLSAITLNPNRPSEIYIGSNNSGILKLENGQPTTRYDQTNTGQNGLESLSIPEDPSYVSVRVHALSFDKGGNLWATNGLVNKGLKKMSSNGSWSSYDIGVSSQYGDLLIDSNGTKWVATLNKGLIGFNEQQQNRTIAINTSYDGGLPYNQVFSIALDKNKKLWIGTALGLRVLSSVDKFASEDQPKVNQVVIIDDGLPQELLYRQSVKKIKIDGADRKWLGTLGAGAFLVSSNGQETLYHFTKENSPLPSNNILDIDINPATGEIYFATDKGMVSFKGTATNASENLSNVYAYPNPVRPEYSGTVKITGLTDEANVKITDIEGNLVYEFKSKGGTVEWDTTAFGNYRVASGVYMVFVTTKDNSETTVKKIMIIR